MSAQIADETVKTFAKTICAEARRYGFRQIDIVRLINAMVDASSDAEPDVGLAPHSGSGVQGPLQVDRSPLRSARLQIRPADAARDLALLRGWTDDQYGRHFLLSSATAQSSDLSALLENPANELGIISNTDGVPIGAVAYLDIDRAQRRAELRKLIGVPSARGQGLAEEATRLWIEYGGQKLGLQKIYVSTLQTHLRNIQLNESIGFRVEGLLQREVLIGDERHDVLRMGLCFDELPG